MAGSTPDSILVNCRCMTCFGDTLSIVMSRINVETFGEILIEIYLFRHMRLEFAASGYDLRVFTRTQNITKLNCRIYT